MNGTQMMNNNKFGFSMCMLFVFRGVRVGYHNTIHVMHMGKHGNAHLIRCKQR